MDLDVQRYLERLAYRGPREVSVDALRQLHHAHLLAVPFENLSIHAGETIQLDEGWLFEKIVGRWRGGFCYELNGLFAALLRTLGFRVDRLAARVFGADGNAGIPFDHMALRVHLEGEWLADVGYGDSFIEPLPLRPGEWQGLRRRYRLRAVGGGEYIVDEQRDGAWKPQYIFSTEPHELGAFAPGCSHHQSSPRSPFTQRRICSRLTETGRVTVRDGMHIVTHADGSKTETAIDDARFGELLASEFGIRGVISAPGERS